MKIVKDCYIKRFSYEEKKRKDRVWQLLCELFFQKIILPKDVVMDIGAGYCEFINHIVCGKKIAIDINPDTKKYANNDVQVLNLSPSTLKIKFKGKIDKVFISNFFEHLDSKEKIIEYLDAVCSVLKMGGKVIIMQPNIKLVNGKYWDFIDHKQPLTTLSLTEALQISGFRIVNAIERFLPFTTKNSYPIFSWMIYLYLKIPSFFRINAGQSLIIAQKYDGI